MSRSNNIKMKELSETKAIEIINKYLKTAQEANVRQYFPVTVSRICNDAQLRDCLIDFLGDTYIYDCMDETYEENVRGTEIQAAIAFLAFCNGKTE